MLTRHTLLTGTILTAIGGYNTYKEYKNASPSQKNRTLTRNMTVMAACVTSVFGTNAFLARKFNSKKIQFFTKNLSKKIIDNKYFKAVTKKIIPKTKFEPIKLEAVADVLDDCTRDILNTTAGLVTAIAAGYVIDKLLVKKSKSNENKKYNKKEIAETQNVTKVASNSTKIFEVAGFMKDPLEKPFIVVDSFNLSKEKEPQKLLEKTTLGIVAGALIPTLFMSVTGTMLKKTKMFVKIPAVALGFFVGSYVGEKAGNALIHEVRDEFFDEEDESQDINDDD